MANFVIMLLSKSYILNKYKNRCKTSTYFSDDRKQLDAKIQADIDNFKNKIYKLIVNFSLS